MAKAKVIVRKPVVVTTQHRGVFFGFIDPAFENERTLDITEVRNCISWSASIGGFMGLAAVGPNRDCKIGKQAPRVVLHDITSVLDCTEEAVKAWQTA